MCGGGGVTYTYEQTDLGLNIVAIKTFSDGNYTHTTIQDSLLREPDCCWGRSPYNRELTEADVDVAKLSMSNQRVVEILADRRVHLRERAEQAEEERQAEAEGRNRGCTLL